jgi:hypothetical protein
MLDLRKLVALLLAPALGSCISEQGTCQLATDAMVMWADVSDLDGKVSVEVELETWVADGEGTSLELCPSRDRLTINGVSASLVRAFGRNYYRAELESPVASVELSLTREQFESVTASIALPPSFDIDSPASGSEFSRANDLTVAWSPAWPGHEIEVSIVDGIGSSCIDGLGLFETSEDDGDFVIVGVSLKDGIAAAASCNVTLLMTREQAADYPGSLHEGGELRASVQRFRTLVSTP